MIDFMMAHPVVAFFMLWLVVAVISDVAGFVTGAATSRVLGKRIDLLVARVSELEKRK
jgi:hypothetical protein